MNKLVKIILIVLLVLTIFIIIDTLKARIFKHSPILSIKKELSDSDSWVDKGIIMNTFYCTKEKDIVTIYYKSKHSKFTCPIE